MSTSSQPTAGSVASLWRYPVKSMMGEELNAADVTPGGLFGDRAYALLDRTDGKVVSAKNPKKWPRLFEFRAAFVEPPRLGASLPMVRITLPDGSVVTSDRDELGRLLSQTLGREVVFESRPPATPTLEEYWPDIEQLSHRNTVTDETIPQGSFYDGATVHLLTTATLDQLRQSHPHGQFEVRRFRPNIVVRPAAGAQGFVETEWIGRSLAIGAEVRLSILRPCPRCVMTTLPQGDLPQDTNILRTAVRENQGNVGVYAAVLCGGTIRRGDSVRVEA